MKSSRLKAMGLVLGVCVCAASLNVDTAAMAAEQQIGVIAQEDDGQQARVQEQSESESQSESEKETESESETEKELPKAETPTAAFEASTGILSNVDDKMKYSIDGGSTWVDITATTVDLSKAELDAEKDIRIVRKGQDTVSTDSEAQILDLTKQGTPVQPVVVNSTDTSITVTAVAGQEYAIKPAADTSAPVWGTVVEFKNLLQNTQYLISTRIPAKGLALQSEAVSVTVKTGVTLPANPTGLKVSTESHEAINIKWNPVTGAESYSLYRSTDNKNFTKVADLKETAYRDVTGLISGTTYYYKVSASRKVDGVTYTSVLSPSSKGRTRIEAPKLSITQKYTKNILKWNEVPNVQMYRVFRATSKNGPYTAIADVSEPTYTDKGRDMAVKYYYKVRGISQTGNNRFYGMYSSVKSTRMVKRPVVMLTESYGGKIRLTWSKVKYSDGIVIYRKEGTSGRLKIHKTFEKGTTRYVSETLTKGDVYRYRVRSYRIINGKKVYGAYSKLQKVTVK